MTTKLSEKKRLEHEERALRTAQGIAQVDRVMLQEDLASKDLYISNVRPDPEQPRRFYPEDEHELAELAESIGRNGLLQPISVRPDPENAGRYVIIVGERRWRASQIAGKTRIRAVIHQMDEYAIRAAQYAENNKRSDVSDVARARSLQAMYEEERGRGGGWAEVAKASGITRMHVNRLTSLLRLPDAVVEMIDRRLLASAHGYEIVRVVNHMADEEIVRLAESCRKPKRGEAFARSVESLREQINEYLDRIQARHVRATVTATTTIPDEIGEGSIATSAVFIQAEQAVGDDPVRGGENREHPPHTAQAAGTSPISPGVRPKISEGTEMALARPISLFEAAITASSGQAASPPAGSLQTKAEADMAEADVAETEGLRPHVKQIVQEIMSDMLRPMETVALRQALERSSIGQ